MITIPTKYNYIGVAQQPLNNHNQSLLGIKFEKTSDKR